MINSLFLFQNHPPHPSQLPYTNPFHHSVHPSHFKPKPITKNLNLGKKSHQLRATESSGGAVNGAVERSGLVDGDGDDDEEEEGVCPVECVREFKTDEEFLKILEKAKGSKALVVVDFFRTSCGSCKYIEQGFAKLCRGAGDEDAGVIFLKHNQMLEPTANCLLITSTRVIDEYDEQSEVAERLRIKVVPLFHFYKDGVLLEAFPTRDKEKIIAAIEKYTSQA